MIRLFLLSITLSSACAPSRSLLLEPAPTASAPASEREDYYRQHRAVGVVSQNPPTLDSVIRTPPYPFLQLEDGRRIFEPSDLLPAVGPDSASGRAALLVEEPMGWSRVLSTAGFVTATVGLAAQLTGVIVLYSSIDSVQPQSEIQERIETAIAVVLGGTAVGLLGVGLMLPGQSLGDTAAIERSTSFMTFDSSLRDRLRVDADGKALLLMEVDSAPATLD